MNTTPQNHAVSSRPDVCAIILAAGRGTRLLNNTDNRPKCLVEVAGRPILSRMLNELERQGIKDIIIAVGYMSDHIRRHVEENYPGLSVRFVENAKYLETGSVYSLALAMNHMLADRHLLIVEGDVVLEPGLCASVLQHTDTSFDASTLLARYEPSLSGTFALVENDQVTNWNHESVRYSDFPLLDSYKTVNITLLNRDKGVPRLREAVQTTIESKGRTAPLEYAMQSLVAEGLRINAAEVNGALWYEVDTPEDLAIANSMFAQGGVA